MAYISNSHILTMLDPVSGRSVPRQTERAADSDLGMTGGHEAVEASRPFWNWSSISLDSGARNIINTTDTSCRGLAGLALP